MSSLYWTSSQRTGELILRTDGEQTIDSIAECDALTRAHRLGEDNLLCQVLNVTERALLRRIFLIDEDKSFGVVSAPAESLTLQGLMQKHFVKKAIRNAVSVIIRRSCLTELGIRRAILEVAAWIMAPIFHLLEGAIELSWEVTEIAFHNGVPLSPCIKIPDIKEHQLSKAPVKDLENAFVRRETILQYAQETIPEGWVLHLGAAGFYRQSHGGCRR